MYVVDVELRAFGRLFALRKDGELPRGRWFGRYCAGGEGAATSWHFRSWTLWHEVLPEGDRSAGFMLTLWQFRLGIGRAYQFAF